MTTLRKTPALSNNGGVKVNDDAYAEEVNANVVALWARTACWLTSIGGTANNITASADAPLTGSPTRPMAFWLVPIAINTANVTLNIDSTGALSVVDLTGSALATGSMVTGSLYLLVFDGTQFRVAFSIGSAGSHAEPDAIFADQKSSGTAGGNFASGSWQPRTLNTTIFNNITGCSLVGNNFLLQPGNYYVEWAAPAQGVNGNISRLFNVTGNTVVSLGDTAYANSGDNENAYGRAVISPSTATTYRIEHQCTASNNPNGFGRPAVIPATPEQYMVVKIYQIGLQPTQINGLPGGAISFFQTFDSSTVNADPGNGEFRLGSATQNTSVATYVDLFDFGLTDLTALLDTFDASTASIKGSLRYTKWDDPTKWLVFNLTARITHSGYREMTLVPVASSAASPFTAGDKVLLSYTPVGPKGDTGSTGAPGSTGTVNAANIGISMINGSLVFTNNGTALTVAIKQADGVTDPTGGSPTMVLMRNGTPSNGTYQIVSITTAKSFTIPSTATLGFSSGVPGRLWFFYTEDGQIGVVNCHDIANNTYPLGQFSLITTLAIAGGSNLALQPYSTTAVSNKAYAVLGYATYETALATAGTWNANPDHIELFHPGMTPLPGQVVQEQSNTTGAVGATTTLSNTFTDTVPNGASGLQVLSQTITPTSQGNLLLITSLVNFASGSSTTSHSLFQDNAGAGTNALMTNTGNSPANVNQLGSAVLRHKMRSNKNGTSTTFTVRANGDSASSYTFNGITTTTRRYGGNLGSYLSAVELQG